MAPKVEDTREQRLQAVSEHVQAAVPAILHRADQLIQQSKASQVVHQQVTETAQASKLLMEVGPGQLVNLAAEIKRVAQATKKLEAADRTGNHAAAQFRKWFGM